MDKPFRASLISALVYNVAVPVGPKETAIVLLIYLVTLVQARRHELSFASSDFTDSLCLFPEYDDDVVGRFVITRFVNDLTLESVGPSWTSGFLASRTRSRQFKRVISTLERN